MRLDFRVPLAPEPIALDRPWTARPQFFVARALVHDHRVRERDPGNVGCFDDDVDVALGRQNNAPDMLGAKIVGGHERILVRADLVVIVGPIVDAGPAIEARFGR